MILNPMRYSRIAKSTKALFPIPVQGGTLTYNGSVQSPAWNNYNTGVMNVSGQTSGTNAGTYTVTFSLIDKDKTSWSDYTTNDKVVNWTIQHGVISSIPFQSGTLTYTGSELYPTWSNYDSTKLTMNGTLSAINAGIYDVIVTPTENYQWADGTTTQEIVEWEIQKAQQNVSITPNSLSLTQENPSAILTVIGAKGTIEADFGSGGYISGSVTGNTITITGHIDTPNSYATVWVGVTGTENYEYFGPEGINVYVSVSGGGDTPTPSGNLSNLTWEQISEYSSNGTISNYASIGDSKQITFVWRNNTITLDAFIIGINHNSELEGNNRTHFQIGKMDSVDGMKLACFVSEYYMDNIPDNNSMNFSNNNNGGWESSELRKYMGTKNSNLVGICLDPAVRAVLKPMTKYSDNLGLNATVPPTQDNITATTDYMVPLSEFEYMGEIVYSNPYERNKQKQYAYYANGNSRVHYQSNNLNLTGKTWTRSTANESDSDFVCIAEDGGPETIGAKESIGLSLVFCV